MSKYFTFSFWEKKYINFLQDSGVRVFSKENKQDVLQVGVPCFGVQKEPQPIYNSKGEIIAGAYVFVPLLYRDETTSNKHICLYTEDTGDFFTLDGDPIRNIERYCADGTDDGVLSIIIFNRRHQVYNLIKKTIVVGMAISLAYLLLTKGK